MAVGLHAQPSQSVGDHPQMGRPFQGGIVFWLTPDGKHGLIAATSDQSAQGLPWVPSAMTETGARSDSVYAGWENTVRIIGKLGTGGPYAARICGELKVVTNGIVYDDWYLPSKEELNHLFRARNTVGGFNQVSGLYWSSTESSSSPAGMAWEQEFRYGQQLEDDKDMPNQVRCIRKF